MYELWLGSETDDALFERIRGAIRSLQGTVSDPEWALGGSQEITTYTISLPSGVLKLESETYIGITVRGPEFLVLTLSKVVNALDQPLSYSSIDPIIGAWAERNGLKLPTHDERGAELPFRNFYTSNNEAECCQVWIDPPQSGVAGLHAASVESRDDKEMRQDWVVPVADLEQGLDTVLVFARAWMTRAT
jgi:hypothetical protein